MDEDLDKTMLGGAGLFGHSGRSRALEISKVENGFQVRAAFNVEFTYDDDGIRRVSNREEKKTFVYYTAEEVVEFVKNYLTAKKDDLRA